MTLTTTEELADAAHALAATFTERRTFEEARAALNEAGMNRARQRLFDTLANIEAAQTAVRSRQEPAVRAKENVDQSVTEAEWELDARFVQEGNKTFLVDGDERKPMTADERKAWKQTEARKLDSVLRAIAAQRDADRSLVEARDTLALAELAFRAARADLDAAIATVQTLATGIRKEAQ